VLSYLSLNKLAGRPVTLTALLIAAAVGILATMYWGHLSDRIGRRPVYLLGCAVVAVWGIPLFLTINTGAAALIVLAFVISYVICQNSLAGVQGAWFSELFAAKTRTTGASLAYQLSAVVSGFTPLLATALYSRYGWIGPALLFSFYGLLGFVAALVTTDTWGPQERIEVERLAQQIAQERAEGRTVIPAGASWAHRTDADTIF
jgi:MFS family permease